MLAEIVLAIVAIVACLSIKRIFSGKETNTKSIGNTNAAKSWDYSKLREMINVNNMKLPCVIVDLDTFDLNTKRLVDIVKPTGKTLRLATKSVRCPYLIKRIFDKGGGVVQGLMTYSVDEAAFLANEGLDDFYVPYPTLQKSDISTAFKLSSSGKKICLTVDSVSHVQILDKICSELTEYAVEKTKLCVAIDLDMSYKFGSLHLGAHRSRLDTLVKVIEVIKAIRASEHLNLCGVMGYEASVAGLPDQNPHAPVPNSIIRYLKGKFYFTGSKLRNDVADYCRQENINLDFFNGGGTGNLIDVSHDAAVTEVTAGSGFLQGQLFDYYIDNVCEPAFCFSLQATRVNSEYICCQSGGFIASGSCSVDKQPTPFANPYILDPYPDEGYGEVQTPLRIKDKRGGIDINPGDPVLFRPAKSGEIAEHFNQYYIKSGYKVIEKVPTYRGLGKTFY